MILFEKLILLIVFIAVIPATVLAESSSSDKGFWEGRPELVARTRDSREILVYVNESEDSNGSKLLTLQAMGVIHMPPSEAAKAAIQYETLKKLSNVINSMQYDAKQKRLVLNTSAFNYTARFIINVEHHLDEKSPRIVWNVVGGFFSGMKLQFVFSPIEGRKSQIALYGVHRYKSLGIPKFFIEFGMEVIMQQAAKRLRALLEEDFS
ncbi:MAG: hypothetical protein R2827_05365 [Bdellovibrionales bacterium]